MPVTVERVALRPQIVRVYERCDLCKRDVRSRPAEPHETEGMILQGYLVCTACWSKQPPVTEVRGVGVCNPDAVSRVIIQDRS